jgi:hypothetical protein
MPNNPLYNFSDQKISFTFQNILQTDGIGNYYNGLGDQIFISGGSGSGGPGATGPTGAPGVTGPTGPYAGFYFQQSPPTVATGDIGFRWMDSDSGIEYVWVYDGVNYLWMQPAQIVSTRYVTSYIGESTYATSFTYNYYGVIYTSGPVDITLPAAQSPNDDGKNITIADERGGISSYGRGINVSAIDGNFINGNTSISMKINWMSLTFIFRNDAWKTI